MKAIPKLDPSAVAVDHVFLQSEQILSASDRPPALSSQDELAWVLARILSLPTRAGTVGDDYLPPLIKQYADVALDRWHRQRAHALTIVPTQR